MDTLSYLQALGSTGGFGKLAQSLIQANIKSNILDIDAKIAHLNSQIRGLNCLRQLERGKITTLRADIAPIRKLPMELLTEIFLLSIEDSFYNCREDVLRLSQVSGYWGQANLSDLHKARMDRSSDPLPLLIWIDTVLLSTDLALLMAVLLSVASRWKSLSTTFASVNSFVGLRPDIFPILQSVRLSGKEEAPEGYLVCALETAPRLKSVTQSPKNGVVCMPWQQLTELDLTLNSPASCRRIMLACQNLVSATLRTAPWATSSDVARIPKTLPFLETLMVSFNLAPRGNPATRCNIGQFFDSFRLPALRPAGRFTHLQRRAPNIEDITLMNVCIDSSKVVDVLRHALRIIHFSLSCEDAFDELALNALLYSDTDFSPLAPRLNYLSVEAAELYVSVAALERVIRYRWWSDGQPQALAVLPRVARLDVLNFCFEDMTIIKDLKVKLRDCINQGLELY
ncbi:hypothetical protein B0H10DRAFT_1947277 [Mycena sp. CBHHK59/15]|nr:hypothetical protein B0H10DRAFT_1947277 [Mycena sp. CBHHK59/15]